MKRVKLVGAVAILVLALGVTPLHAQGYRIRLDTRLQSLSLRGLTVDSALRTALSVDPTTQGFRTPDGYAATCVEGETYCTFFRPGPATSVSPVSGTASGTFWGLGVPGLQVHAVARADGNLTSTDWPGTEPAVQLLEGYADYSSGAVTVQAGRVHDANRLGWVGFDGGKLELRPFGRALRIFGYGGLGLVRSFPLPVTSQDINPLGDTLPGRRQLVLAGGFGWFVSDFEGRVLYQREDRRGSNATVSERVSADWSLAASPQVRLSGGGDYDMASDEWGKADLAVSYLANNQRLRLTLGGRRYRPYFDLWTIWGAFTPVAYSAGSGQAAWQVIDGFEVRARGEVYQYDDPGTATPKVSIENSGWRGSVSASLARFSNWSLDAGWERDIGPGASSQSFEAAATYRISPSLLVTADGARMVRPLEYRFDDARLWSYGLHLDFEAVRGVRLVGDARGYSEDRRRDDAGALSWSQFRVNLGATIEFGSGGDTRSLHPAILLIPEGRRPK